jgi:hypothetical protein
MSHGVSEQASCQVGDRRNETPNGRMIINILLSIIKREFLVVKNEIK